MIAANDASVRVFASKVEPRGVIDGRKIYSVTVQSGADKYVASVSVTPTRGVICYGVKTRGGRKAAYGARRADVERAAMAAAAKAAG